MHRPLLIGLVVAFVALHIFLKQRSSEVAPGTPTASASASALEQLRGPVAAKVVEAARANKITVVAFFETWCGPCKLELPHLAKLYEERRADGLAVVGIYGASSHDVDGFLRENHIGFPTLRDDQGELTRLWQVDDVPTSVLLDADLKVLQTVRGYQPGFAHDIAAMLDGMLRL